ncbi:hypothetical protein H072_6799 [Dactylellina haptotyla CBS 200.50]|uniref:Uncharacterized protein n=1 Tax=Dactylellina haptotyla (strain CBS 200.50) TaxID=1284197 RepID=S8A992_DACHA|nr:hypothetical protein H072_6799 [Dactylellina haptotyla CBS 200.50]
MTKIGLLLLSSLSLASVTLAARNPYPGDISKQAKTALENLRNQQAANPSAQRQPDEIDWAPAGELISVTPQQWADFENSLSIGDDREGPIWFLHVAVRRFLQLSHSVTTTAILLQGALEDRGEEGAEQIFDQFIVRVSGIVSFLDNYLYEPPNQRHNFVENPEMITQNHGESPELQNAVASMLTKLEELPGLMNRGGVLDPGTRDEPSTIATNVLLRRLFDYNAGKTATDTDILLSDGFFLEAWEGVYRVMENLADFQEEVTPIIEGLRLKYMPANYYWDVAFDPYPVGLWDREEIGYEEYWVSKYEPSTRSPGDDTRLGERWGGYNINDVDIAQMCASLLLQLDAMSRGVLPFMMDALADTALKANDLAKISRWPRSNWALLDIPELAPSIELLREYPEWSEGVYSTAATNWPEFGPINRIQAAVIARNEEVDPEIEQPDQDDLGN